ncbi:MAG: hypothetical protein IJ668_04775, partial [Selenomonadaceae bacterium]|nr:hypothetical protein [Selenomonadaceae bacterium]
LSKELCGDGEKDGRPPAHVAARPNPIIRPNILSSSMNFIRRHGKKGGRPRARRRPFLFSTPIKIFEPMSNEEGRAPREQGAALYFPQPQKFFLSKELCSDG